MAKVKRYTRNEAEYQALLDCLRAVKKQYLLGRFRGTLGTDQVKRVVSQILIGANIKEFHLSVKDG